MKFVDLSANPPKEVTVLTIREIATQITGSNYGSYSLAATFQNWHDDEKVATPKPAYTISETEYWLPAQVAEWQKLHDEEIEKEEDRKAKKLAEQKISFNDIIEKLLERAEYVAQRNLGCYTHNRGNSMQDGRKRVLELLGMKEFTDILLGEHSMTKEQRTKWRQSVDSAKASVKMQ